MQGAKSEEVRRRLEEIAKEYAKRVGLDWENRTELDSDEIIHTLVGILLNQYKAFIDYLEEGDIAIIHAWEENGVADILIVEDPFNVVGYVF